MLFRGNSQLQVTAQQWWPPDDLRHDPTMLVARKGNAVDPPDYLQQGDLYCAIPARRLGMGGEDIYVLKAARGDQRLKPGDWVVATPTEKFACSPGLFAELFQECPTPKPAVEE